MYGTNMALIKGALTRTPELTRRGDHDVVELTVAGTEQQAGRPVPFYINTTLFGAAAQRFIAAGPQAGDVVMVKGQAEFRTWTNNGAERKNVRFQALLIDRVQEEGAELITDASGGVRLANGMNVIFFGGNVTRDPELRYTPQGDAVIDIDVACNQRYTTRDGKPAERTDYVTVTLWRELAEAHKDLRKGASVSTTGVLISHSWMDRETSEKRSTLKIQASHFTELMPLTKDAARPASERTPAAQPARPAVQSETRTGKAAAPRPAATRPAPVAAQTAASTNFEEEDLPF